MSSEPKDDGEVSIEMHNKKVPYKEEVQQGPINTVHVDRIMALIDPDTETVILTLFNKHIMPVSSPTGGIDFSSVSWEIVGELKVPLSIMNGLVSYYVQDFTQGLQIWPLIVKYLKEHPRDRTKVSYGPSSIKQW